MTKFAPSLRIPPKPARSELRGQMIWCCENGGSDRFPQSIDAIKARRYASHPRPLEAFGKAVMHSAERVWIIDDYFLAADPNGIDERLRTVLAWLHVSIEARDIRILTGSHREINEERIGLFQSRQLEINRAQSHREQLCKISVNTHLRRHFDLIHDRFAIIDDELWHFGATVGGFHQCVNAASRGWSAVESGAIEFYELAWSKCGGS